MLALSTAELQILDWIASHCRTAWLDVIFPVITYLGSLGIVWIVLALALMAMKSQRAVGIQVALALIFSLLLCNGVVKPLVDRIRPYELAQLTELLVIPPIDASFPSGHSSAAFAVATVLLRSRHPLRWPALILAALIALSRLYLYMHFPTDVIAGILLGILCGTLATALWRKRLQPYIIKRQAKKDAP